MAKLKIETPQLPVDCLESAAERITRIIARKRSRGALQMGHLVQLQNDTLRLLNRMRTVQAGAGKGNDAQH